MATLQTLRGSGLIQLNKNPGLLPVGTREVSPGIAGKFVMYVAKKDVLDAPGALQVCSGQDAPTEAAIHTTQDLFHNGKIEAVLIIDAENAFNSISREVMLHDISIM